MKRRVADLPLHRGRAPRWLFERMTDLAGAVTMAIVDEYGPREMLRRLSDPWWFQAFGCVLGFDWHSSGLTTVTCGALKEAYRERGADLGVIVAGGKGAASRRTPREIAEGADAHAVAGGERLIRASRMSAKVDSSAVQDGHQVYHHAFFFLPDGGWCVVQQGMDGEAGRARRYHWLGESVDDFVCEPHAGMRDLGSGSTGGPAPAGTEGDGGQGVLDLSDRASDGNRAACAELARLDPDRVAREALRLTEGPTLFAPDRHRLLPEDVDPDHLRRTLRGVHERHPEDFETLLGTRGVGPKTVRSLALLAEVVHGASPSREDPARRWADYAHAHGGKDGTPRPVDREAYDRSVRVLRDAVRRARLGDRRKSEALERLADWTMEDAEPTAPGGNPPGGGDEAHPAGRTR